ncbi:AAA family ATPase [Sinorhizobium meliloti]|uniref:AAA family ATPase n=1 Tax=Rhizobium meliloti TaxID=382 RepID=UPI00299D63A6|nr:AAA family ATPase [Sinorhizobium meliloti]
MIPCLIGVCGFTGAGKTTALKILRSKVGGDLIYLGQAVYDELDRRSLQRTPENERHVRLELRKADNAAFAKLCRPAITKCLEGGKTALIDAVMALEEYEFLAGKLTCPVNLLQIDAGIDIRAARLEQRLDRPMTREQAEKRDKVELDTLCIDRVFAKATHTIVNESSMQAFEAALDGFIAQKVR